MYPGGFPLYNSRYTGSPNCRGSPLGCSWAPRTWRTSQSCLPEGILESKRLLHGQMWVPELLGQIQVRPYSCTILACPVLMCCNALFYELQCPVLYVAMPCFKCCRPCFMQCPVSSVAMPFVKCCNARLSSTAAILDYIALQSALCCVL